MRDERGVGAGRGVQAGEVETPAMVAEARRETKWGAESDEDEEGDGGGGAQDSERVWVTYKVFKYNISCDTS